jgi:hypothetical protein
MPTTIRDICTDALTEIGVVGSGAPMDANDAEFAYGKLRRLINEWNAQRCAVYATVFSQFALTPSLSPHTIGPTAATWTVVQRPVSIEAISLILDSSNPDVYLPLNKRDAAWWQAQITPTIEVDIPSDFYYDPTWPNGSVYFWPVPSAAYDVQVQIRTLLDETFTLNSTFSLPPGYQEAITLTLAEKSARGFGRPVTEDLMSDARNARALIFANNDTTPTLVTRDAGMEGPRGGIRSGFNWITGGPTQ